MALVQVGDLNMPGSDHLMTIHHSSASLLIVLTTFIIGGCEPMFSCMIPTSRDCRPFGALQGRHDAAPAEPAAPETPEKPLIVCRDAARNYYGINADV
jgi:hypothetical protein